MLQQMKHSGKLNNFPRFFSYHPMCQLGINNLLTTRCKWFLVFCMLTNLGVKPIPFFHIKPHTPHNFLTTHMLIKGGNKYFVFPSISIQSLHLIMCKVPSSLTNNSTHGNFASHISWNFLVTS
jgi:hypothetical protein